MNPIRSYAEVEKYVRTGLFAIGFQVLVTVGMVAVGSLVDLEGQFAAYGDPMNLLDVVLLLVFGVGLQLRSRAAAISLMAYFALARLVLLLSEGLAGFAGLAVSILILVIYAKATQACFAHHRLRREEDPAYRPKVWPVAAAGVLMVSTLVCVGLGAGLLSVLAPAGLVEASALEPAHVGSLRDAGILEPGETLELGDFTSLDRITEQGTVLTDRRFVHFEQGLAGGVLVDSRERLQIQSVRTEVNPLGAVLFVQAFGQPPMEAWVSSEASALRFTERLQGVSDM